MRDVRDSRGAGVDAGDHGPRPSPGKRSRTEALEPSVRASMERSFGVDLSAVRVHHSGEPEAMGAEAFAQGPDIHMAAGRYDPGSVSGRELIGHEVAHVVQQSQGRVNASRQYRGAPINDDPALESEADVQGARAARGEAAGGGRPALLDGPLPALQCVVNAPRQGFFTHGRGKLDRDMRTAIRRYLEAHAKEKVVDDFDDRAGSAEDEGAVSAWLKSKGINTSVRAIMEAADDELGGGGGTAASKREKKEKASEIAAAPKAATPAAAPAVASAPRLTMTQFGGGTGSYAGDAFLMNLHDSRRRFGIDMGHGAQAAAARAQRHHADKDDPSPSESEWESGDEGDSGRHKRALVTHNHKDHVGDAADRDDHELLLVGASAPKSTAKQQKLNGGDSLFHWNHPDSGLSASGSAIAPLAESKTKKKVDENERSLGALIKVDHTEADTPTRKFTFLTLGDMTPREAQKPVSAAIMADGNPIDLIKMSHHGSEHNIGAIPASAIGPTTRILISGYTMTATDKLSKFLQGKKHGEVYILFQTKEDAAKLTTTAAWKTLVARGVKLAKDYVITVDEAGTVTQSAIEFKD